MGRFEKKTTGLFTSLDFKKPSVKVFYFLSFAFLMILALASLIPPLWVMLSSLKDTKEFFQVPPTLIPKTFHFEKLADTWKMLQFGKYVVNSLTICAGSVVSNILFNGLVGYVLSRLKPKGSVAVMSAILWTMLLPNTVSMVPVFKNILDFPLLHINLADSYLPLWMMAGANAFYVLVFKSFFDGIPMALNEAARLDGCGSLSIFFRIILPLSKPVLVVATIFTLNNTWGDFFWPFLILRNPDRYSVMIRIYSISNSAVPKDVVVIALMFTIIPPVIMFAFFQKYLMQGFTLSGIKG